MKCEVLCVALVLTRLSDSTYLLLAPIILSVGVGEAGARRRRRRRSYGPLTHLDVGRKSKTWSPVKPLISTPTSLSRVRVQPASTSDNPPGSQ